MKKLFKILGIVFLLIIVAVVAGLIYFSAAYPDVDPPEDIIIEKTPSRLERGEYLAMHVAVCIDCHSERDWSKFSGPVVPGTFGMGGERFDESMGFPGALFASNITPAMLSRYSDGELIRAITSGITKEGRALFPIMPYHNFNQLSQEDLYSIITYIRTLDPIEHDVPESSLNFPMNFIVKTMPIKTYEPKDAPSKDNIKEYGKYISTIASCADCHTPSVKGEPVPGMYMAGGMEFQLPGGTLRAVNITPDKETGIGNWTKEDFIDRFRLSLSDSVQNQQVDINGFFTIMPWAMYAGMTDEDLGAIFEYLHSIPPVKSSIERFTSR